MKKLIQLFFVVFSLCYTSALNAQWFNDNMGTITSGGAPCPWDNPSIMPPGVTNDGVCVTGSNGAPAWGVGASGGGYGWGTTSAGNTACTFTYTLVVTGSATVTTVNFDVRSSTTNGPNTLVFTINGVSYNRTITTGSDFNPVSIDVTDFTVNGVTLPITMAFTGANSGSGNWTCRLDNFQIFGSTLPVELTGFNAKPAPQGVDLSWNTASERNNNYFAVERSADGRNFSEIGKINGAGESSSAKEYGFTDPKPLKGVNYYRLKQMDFDGQFEYSKIVSVTIGKTGGVRVFPTIDVAETLRVQFDEPAEEATLWQVIDASGRVVSSGSFDAEISEYDLPVAQLPAGAYFLRLATGRMAVTEAFRK